MMMQFFDMCHNQTVARVLLRYPSDNGKWETVMCSAFGDMVYQLANIHNSEAVTKQDLLNGQKFQQVRFLTDKKIIISILA